jgi:hypothetical protein
VKKILTEKQFGFIFIMDDLKALIITALDMDKKERKRYERK